jgi:1-acyl-sn-glycerol-3-phosphate acyltransferase
VYGIDHLENLVSPVIFVANHCSHLDAPLIVSSLPDRISDRLAVNAASDYYFDVRWRTIPAALFFNTFAVGRYGAAGRQASQAAQLLEDKWNILLFPEGTRGDDGTMGMFRLGAAQLSLAQGVPIVPVSLAGTYWAMPKGRSWPLPGRPPVIIRYGRPLFPQPGEGMRELRDRMMTAVAKLAAEENLGWYGAMRAQIDGSLPTRPARARSSRWRRTWESTRPLKAYSRRRTWRW